MKSYLKNIFVFIFLGISFYFISSCNKENPVNSNSNQDLGILRTDEEGHILGGDYSDWCIHAAVDTFTYLRYFFVNSVSNNIAQLKWVTWKEYHNNRFEVERKLKTDTTYSRIGSIPAVGNSNDSVIYFYYDTLATSVPHFDYRLKVFDIWGNFKYINVGYILIIYSVPNSFFGPAYPNPVSSLSFHLGFAIPRNDTVSIYFLNDFDTIFAIKNMAAQKGTYELSIENIYNFHNVQKRFYIKCKTLVQTDSCKYYGDVQFN